VDNFYSLLCKFDYDPIAIFDIQTQNIILLKNIIDEIIMKYFFSYIFILIACGNSLAQKDFDWETYFEKSGYISTANYKQTRDYCEDLITHSNKMRINQFEKSPQGRDLFFLTLTESGYIQEKLRDKPLVLIINGIHSGEIEGKDASMLLMREILISKEKEYLLDSLNIIVVPVFNVDGHERTSKYNRINQNGPEEMGWRTTAQNLNLNRDWMKADAREMKWMLWLINKYQPDFMIDTHTTDGADYQYTVTYSVEWSKNIYRQTGKWLKENFVPYLEKGVEDKGYLVAPYIYLKEWNKGLDGGLVYWPATPRFSTGYFALQNRPSLLVETHMIKPYKDRVYSTKAMLETTLDFIHNNATSLINLNKEADEQSTKMYGGEENYLPLAYDRSEKYELINFKGYEYYWEPSYISGTEKLVYTNSKKDFTVKYYNEIFLTDSVKIPKGYLIPLEWENFADKMNGLHNVKTDLFSMGTSVSIEKYKLFNVEFDSVSYEGRQRVNFNCKILKEEITLDQDMIYIPTNQKSVGVIVNLLEPKSADSYVRWGFMNQIFEQKEYYEDYVMEKIAEEMLVNDPDLKREFEYNLENDEKFKDDPRARLDFFYERSPYVDKQKNFYPILRVVE